MKKFLLIGCFFILTVKAFGQRFSQYNTGTLYDSFENPSQRSFIPDSSKQFAFNFLAPNLDLNFYVAGNAQTALKTRLFSSYYNTAALQVGKGKYNYGNANASDYSIMFKIFTSLNGNQEIGFFTKTKLESRGAVTDESIALFNGYSNFPNDSYSNVFNDNYFYQAYNQIGFSYREQVTKRFALGVKLSGLSGIIYKKVGINQSQIDFDRENDQATVSLQGTAYTSGNSDKVTLLQKSGMAFRNPGAAISIGASYINEGGYTFQYNIKDLGFIHWNKSSTVANFSDDTVKIKGLSTPNRESNITKTLTSITDGNSTMKSFNSPIDGLAEISVNKTYWFDYDKTVKFSPTLIASKELFYSGFTGAVVAPVQYQKYIVSLTSSYNDLRLFNLGGQFMIKTPNGEFFIGSETLYQSASLLHTALKGEIADKSQYLTNQGAFSGASFFIGFSFKFGNLIEHPMNASYIPNGEKGFLGRLYERIFKKDKNY
jgi:hypothetical protein